MHSTMSQSWMFQLAFHYCNHTIKSVAIKSVAIKSVAIKSEVSRALITAEIALLHFPVTIFVIFRGMQL